MPKRTNYVRARVWTPTQQLEIAGTIPAAVRDLFISVPQDQRESLLAELQEIQGRARVSWQEALQ